MNRVESRPAHTGLWQYALFIDAGGRANEAPLREARQKRGAFAAGVTVPGSYPAAMS